MPCAGAPSPGAPANGPRGSGPRSLLTPHQPSELLLAGGERDGPVEGVPERQLLLGAHRDGVLGGGLHLLAGLDDEDGADVVADADLAQLGGLGEDGLAVLVEPDHERSGGAGLGHDDTPILALYSDMQYNASGRSRGR